MCVVAISGLIAVPHSEVNNDSNMEMAMRESKRDQNERKQIHKTNNNKNVSN